MHHSELQRAVTLTELAPSPYVSIKKVSLANIKVFETFDEFHKLLRKSQSVTDGKIDEQMDGQTWKQNPPPPNKHTSQGV